MLKIITYHDAKAQSLSKFFTGKMCRNGHVAERYIGSRSCVVCASDNEKRYKERNAEQATARRKAYRVKNHDRLLAADKVYRESHKAQRAYHRKNYKKRNLERTPRWFGEFDEFVLMEATILCEQRQKETGFEWHVDHMYPLNAKKVSGLHCAENFQVIPAVMNESKQNKMIMTERYQWLKR